MSIRIEYEHTQDRSRSDLIDDLWEHELNYITHVELVELARQKFRKSLALYGYDRLRSHYDEILG